MAWRASSGAVEFIAVMGVVDTGPGINAWMTVGAWLTAGGGGAYFNRMVWRKGLVPVFMCLVVECVTLTTFTFAVGHNPVCWRACIGTAGNVEEVTVDGAVTGDTSAIMDGVGKRSGTSRCAGMTTGTVLNIGCGGGIDDNGRLMVVSVTVEVTGMAILTVGTDPVSGRGAA